MKALVTGSHFTPAQAVIKELKKFKDIDIVYIGRKTTIEGDKTPSVESKVLPTLGVKYLTITAGRLQRSFTPYTFLSLLKIPVGFVQSFAILLNEKPDVVISFGGYVAVPTVFSAWLLNIPVIIHEQTLVTGLANTISSFFADKIAVSFKDAVLFDKRKQVVTGNPMREELVNFAEEGLEEFIKIAKKAKSEKLPLILVTGGNQGSHLLNQTIGEILDELTEISFVIHQTGDSKYKDFEYLKENQIKNPERYLVKKWIDAKDVGYIFKNIDLAVSRAGINTLQELSYFGIPTLLVPIPYLYKNEQEVNAKFFKELGLAKVIKQSELDGQKLLETIKEAFSKLTELKERAKRSKEVVILDAAKRLTQEILILAEKKE
ncbi:MAG: hypothetical protein US86_C0001G0082 [Candidatus Daviesbacteria bacterium GW2011_GWA2_38_24]|uniref:UDP-N-acetylglucosamine--N-acetylmuramyl-(pentapeptide) pyrophosphoryl-undecaprenol N-acetylglucosamine transferase n=1 Tax=Candidatus Daviesbacteria bacterium GW2011_GWA2_38_24 TaxID=1618422 RepID=A0A0G0JVQ1_9BACT|nr:MAG: hypothetical protein US86_C0001G0082 [Candidatus Daviesbacteria bacterium GW2011_GWA2_38_24]KKQ78953.1 MAG: hypothetical protein UT01_C0055G0003 [Candidatus Daviesbacteria bacterium GW2011_GWA1_38_7]OGE23943.1 MAG: hypothetical protein A2688_00155 [Candidatus Daviesbacteria bacterium RIFCSPHIGHO2_01_FULL_38_8]